MNAVHGFMVGQNYRNPFNPLTVLPFNRRFTFQLFPVSRSFEPAMSQDKYRNYSTGKPASYKPTGYHTFIPSDFQRTVNPRDFSSRN